uniref:ABC transporter domain-containing protein n=1 Tax=Amphiprion ocellaris TaxID=80972 RepID=A0AAQ6A9B3_AMPOC
MGLLTQFTLLLWKNFTLRKRQKVRLVVEVVWPLFLFIILVWVRSTNKPIYKGQCHYPNKAMPSAGVLPWIQGMMCNMDNPCMSYPTPGEAPGQVNNFDNSMYVLESSIFCPLRQQHTMMKSGQMQSSLVCQLIPKLLFIFQVMDTPRPGNLRRILCEGTDLDEYVQFRSQAEKEAFQNVSCSLSPQQLINTQQVLLQNLDGRKVFSKVKFSCVLGLAVTFPVFSAHLVSCVGDFCQTLIDTLESSSSLRYFWSAVKPLLLGRVVYTPDTPAARLLANSTFDALAKIKELADSWDELGPRVWDFFQNSTQINTMRALLANPVFAAALDERLNSTGLTAEMIRNFLYNGPPEDRPPGAPPFDWRDAYNSTTQILQLISKFLGHLVTRALDLLGNDTFWAGFVFENLQENSSDIPPYVKYKIRMDIDEVEQTNKIKERLWSPGARDNSASDLRYIWGGFAYLQDMMDHGIIRAQTSKTQPLGVFAQQMPYPCYVDDVIGAMLPMFLVLAFMYTVSMTIKSLVLEKELRLKEVLRAVGFQNGTLWSARFAENIVLLTVPCYGKVLQYSDPSVIFVFLLVFCLATVTECFFISVFFSKANLAAACGGLIYFVLYLPHVLCYAWSDVMGFQAKVAVSLLSCVAFGYGCESFAKYEQQGIGIQWHNINKSPEEGERYTFVISIVMMLVDAVIHWLLTWYIENVFPGQYGIPKPWYFPFTKSYWCGTIPVTDENPDLLQDSTEYNSKLLFSISFLPLVCILSYLYSFTCFLCLFLCFYACVCEEYLEKPPPNMKAGVSVRNLVKIYKTGKKLAVDGLSVDFFESQITSFLGHNGAGKTTTMSILTGLFPPTSGTAFINGYNICTDMDRIRKYLGMCPQHNVLFNELTVEEHIYFYARLKGRSRAEVKMEMDQMIEDVGLPHKRKDLAKNLSGGMQRKLSVAIAFVGGSKIVILDEPTAGVDPYARRGIWELLLKYKQGRTIILSTHHMDEADILGDRIAIISHGKMRCCGSSLFLKKCFGSGYYLTLVRDGTEKMAAQRSANCSSYSYLTAVGELVRRHVPEAVFLESIGQEITYILPYGGARDGTFAHLFQDLDRAMNNLGLTSYGISDTTLEEVKPTDNWHLQQICAQPRNLKKNASLSGRGSTVITGWKLIRRQFLALFIKRFHHARRSRKGLIAQVVLPAVFVCLSLIFSLIVPPFTEYPSLELQPWMYDLPQTTFYSNDLPESAEVSQVVETLLNNPGFGTRCMNGDPIPNLPCTNSRSDWFTPPVDQSVTDIFLNGNWNMSNPSPPCQCSTPQRTFMLPDCPPGAGGLPPPQRVQNTTDTLLNLTGRNMTDFLLLHTLLSLSTFHDLPVEFFHIICPRPNQPPVALPDVVARRHPKLLQSLCMLFSVPTLVSFPRQVWFYNEAWHSMVSFLGVANNGILRGNLPAGQDPRKYGISISNHPLNLTKEQLSYAALATTSTNVVVSICVIFAMSFIPASFVLFLIQERVNKAKHLQFVSGVNPTVYWLANFAWDMCNYIVPCLIVIVIFLCFQQKAYVSPPNLPALILLLVFYGWAITPMMYPASFIFSVPSTAYVVLTCINLFIGINGSIATFVMELFDDDVSNVTRINDIVKQVLLIFPHFCLGRGLIDMASNQAMADLYSGFGEDRFQDPLSWDMVGKNLCAMSIQGFVMFAITILIQYKFFSKPLAAEEEDIDVARERKRVYEGKAQNDLLRICDLTKQCFPNGGLPCCLHQCFGLLGINGAGKTTTFKMLTGDIPVSSGEAFLNGYSIRTEMRDVHQNLGYCPQFDAIDDLLTGREHLEFYARLRGVPENEVAMVAEWGIQKLGLVKYSTKSAGTYSGGNKRKLSTAMALIGSPPVIFLDEPTTGMDPKARRFLWDCILSVIKEGRSVILTSHSMEECEALCTRMAIMVNGRFKCLGSIQHLKNRFGDGYTVIVRVGGSRPALKPVEDFLQVNFPGSVLKEKHHNTLQYQLPYTQGALTSIFNLFTSHQQRLHIEDYSVSQTTLDQVSQVQAKFLLHTAISSPLQMMQE